MSGLLRRWVCGHLSRYMPEALYSLGLVSAGSSVHSPQSPLFSTLLSYSGGNLGFLLRSSELVSGEHTQRTKQRGWQGVHLKYANRSATDRLGLMGRYQQDFRKSCWLEGLLWIKNLKRTQMSSGPWGRTARLRPRPAPDARATFPSTCSFLLPSSLFPFSLPSHSLIPPSPTPSFFASSLPETECRT